jgi:ribonuclease BN (tRNA processing enzyme)
VRLTVVGCSGSFPGPDAAASCYLVEADDAVGRTWRIVLDLGSGSLGPLHRHVAPRMLDAVLISHLHPDHFVDLCGLYVALRYDPASPRVEQLPVYGPAGTFARLQEAYGQHEGGSMERAFAVGEWDDGTPLVLGPFTVTPRRVQHPVTAFGLRVEAQGAVLAYSGDTDTCPELVELATGADLLLAEASFEEGRDTARGVHLTGLRAGQTAAAAGSRRLVLTHLPVWTSARTVLAEARSAYSGPVEVAHPGLRITLP